MQRNIYLLYIIKVAKWFMLTMPILMLFYSDLGFTTAQSFQLKAFYSVSIVIFDLPSGYIADIIGRKMSLIIGAILGTLGFLIYSSFSGFYFFLLAEITLGIGQSFINGADSALLYDSLRQNNREKEYLKYEGRLFSAGNFAEALGSLTGGFIAHYSLRLPFIAQTCIAFLAIPAALMLVEPTISKGARKSFATLLLTIRNTITTNAPLRWNLIFSALIGSATLTMAWIYQLRLKQTGYDAIEIGTLAMILNIVAGLVTFFAYRIESQLKPKATLWFTSMLITLSFILSAYTKSYWLIIVFMLFYTARGVANPVLKEYVNRVTSSDVRATILSLRSLLIRAMFAVIGPFFGWYTDLYSLQEAMTILGIVFTILSAITIFAFFKTAKQNNISH